MQAVNDVLQSFFRGLQCLAEFLSARVNNALTYVFTRSTLDRSDVRSVFYTVQSLDAPPSVDGFKFHMGYTAKALRQRVVFHPWAEPLVRPATSRTVRFAAPPPAGFAAALETLRGAAA